MTKTMLVLIISLNRKKSLNCSGIYIRVKLHPRYCIKLYTSLYIWNHMSDSKDVCFGNVRLMRHLLKMYDYQLWFDECMVGGYAFRDLWMFDMPLFIHNCKNYFTHSQSFLGIWMIEEFCLLIWKMKKKWKIVKKKKSEEKKYRI